MITIIGRHDFIGSALEKRLSKFNEINSYILNQKNLSEYKVN